MPPLPPVSDLPAPRRPHDEGPRPLTSHQQAFGRVLEGLAVLAAVTHLAFMGVMAWADVPTLAFANVASVLCYVLMYLLCKRQRLMAALVLAGTEVVAHAVAAVWTIGWDSGFHYYILLTMPVVVLSSVARPIHKIAGVPLLTAIYLALDVLARHRVPTRVLDPQVLDYLHYFNVLSSVVILVFLAAFYFQQINRVEELLRELATTDPLTQLRNRRALMEVIRHEERRLHRGQQVLSFVLADIDHFKPVNDQHGHDIGDQALTAVSQALTEGVRDVDHLARWGGEEFLIVLPDADEARAAQVAERLRELVAGTRVTLPQGVLALTMSFGVSEIAAGETAEQAISRADAALYAAKHAGRDRVVCASALT